MKHNASEMIELEFILRKSFGSFVEEVRSSAWTGRREREAVSLFAFGHLLRQVRAGSFLHNPAQIGIEIPVPQIATLDQTNNRTVKKAQVCKDLVIWPRPGMTCWDQSGNPTVSPAAILEWKFGVESIDKYDLDWLTEFSIEHADFIGFAISANRPGKSFLMKVAKVYNGTADRNWLCL